MIRARIPLAALEKVASWHDVRRVGVATGWISAHMPVRARGSKAAEAARLEAVLAPVVSEGDEAHAADVARAEHTGDRRRGSKVCVLSDGVDALAASQAAGELPAVDVLPDQAGTGDEGTAMLEIVHDLAPNAEMGAPTATESAESQVRGQYLSAGLRAQEAPTSLSMTSSTSLNQTFPGGVDRAERSSM